MKLLRKKITVTIILFLVVLITNAQISFEKVYEGKDNAAIGYSVSQTKDNGYIITGELRKDFGLSDVYLMKTDAYGDTLWTQTYGGTLDYSRGHSVQQTNDNGYIIAGDNPKGVYLIKTDSTGDTTWTKTYRATHSGRYYGTSVRQTIDGGFIVAGYAMYNVFGSPANEFLLIKTNSLGDRLWTKTYGGEGDHQSYCVQQTSDKGFIVAGLTSGPTTTYDVWVIKTDSVGDTLWTQTYGGTEIDQGYSIQQTHDKGYIIAGYTSSFGGSDKDAYLVRIDSTGDTLWTKTFDSATDAEIHSVCETHDKGFILTGYVDPPASGSGSGVYVVRTDSDGNPVWTKTYGNVNDKGYSVQQTHDHGFIIAGVTGIGGLYLIKTKPDGHVGFEEKVTESNNISLYPNPTTGSFQVKGITSGPDGIKVEVYDMSGKTVFARKYRKDSPAINIENLTPGVYFVKLIVQDQTAVRKVIKR